MHGSTLKQPQLLKKVPGDAMLIFFPQFRTNVSLLESFFRILPALSAKIDDIFGCMGVPSNNHNFGIEVQGYAMLIFLPQFRTNVSLFESGICLGPAELWNSLEARMLYDKCIEN